jgi:hypothetical protein
MMMCGKYGQVIKWTIGIDTLMLKGKINKKGGEYFVYDVFFSRWFELQEI